MRAVYRLVGRRDPVPGRRQGRHGRFGLPIAFSRSAPAPPEAALEDATMNRWTLAAILLATAMQVDAAIFTVDDAGTASDSNSADGTCTTAAGKCTLFAAIQQANANSNVDTIKFGSSFTKITLGASLPALIHPAILDGTSANAASGGRFEIDGAAVNGCFDINTNGATVKNFVVRRCSGNGIDVSGHNNKITGNRIGTNPAADANSSATDANSGDGISLSGTIPVAAALPTLAAQLATLPQDYAGVTAMSAAMSAAIVAQLPLAQPNLISGNVVSGNSGNGIDIFGQGTVNTIVTGNIVGLSQDGLSAIPNGRGPGDAYSRAGIRISGTAYGNFIGPANIVSGNLGVGIALDPGQVQLPNFVAGNLIGLGSAPIAQVGNAEQGIEIDTTPKTSGGGANNPTGLSAIIGPANTISDNKAEPPTQDLDVMNSDESGGLLINGNARGIKVFANVVGLATFPAGATPLGQLQYGNVGNGLVVTGSNNEIRNNLILANGRHGIVLRGSSAHSNVIRGNYIGVSVPTGLSALLGLGNGGDGIHFFSAGGNTIGGPADSDANVIAANGRHGIAMRSSNSWANLVTRNRIYGNATIHPAGLPIDLEHPVNGPDGVDTLDNGSQFSLNYANRDQHRPVICGGASPPAQCAGAEAPISDGSGGGTAVQWTLVTRPNANDTIRVEFFANAADGSDSVFLGEKVIDTDANGRPTGPGCANGLCTTSVGGSTNAAGMRIVATATDLTPDDVPPTGDQPAPNPLSASNNTSEYSDHVTATPKLEITTQPPLAKGTTNTQYPSLTFAATGGSGVYTNWVVSSGNAPDGLLLGAASGVLSGTPTVANTFNFTVKVTDSEGAEATKAYSIQIAAQPPLVINTASPLPGGTMGTAYGPVTFVASGGNGAAEDWEVQSGDLPAGLSLSSTGVLDGTPTEVGTFEFNVQTTDQQPTTVVKPFSLTVVPAPVPLAITTATPLTNATATVYYERVFEATGGSGVYVEWAVTSGTLPSGMTLDAASGKLSGKANAGGSFTFTVRVTDDAATMASKAFTLTVAPAPEPPPAGPVFSASPADIDFGEVNVGRTAFANVRLTNLSDAPITPRLTTPPADSGFAVDYGDCDDAGGTPQPLAAGDFCTMTVAFTPTAGDGASFSSSSRVCRSILLNNCTLVFNGPSNFLARLTYRGIGSGTLAQVAPTKIDYGSQVLGSNTDVVVTVTNPTDASLVFALPLVQSNPGPFTLFNNTCGFGIVTVSTPCQLTFRFTPAALGEAESTTRISVRNIDSTIIEPYDIELRGTGVAVPDPLTTTPVALDFGEVNVGTIAQIPVVTRNTSGVQLGIFAQLFGTGETVWSRVIGGCPNPVNPNQTCTWNYRFSPRVRGEFATSSEIQGTGVSVAYAVPLSLSGVGVGSLVEVTPKQLDFGFVELGDTGIGRVDITNTSAHDLTRTFLEPSPFLDSTTCPAIILAGATCRINYTLPGNDPAGFRVSQATLLFEHAASGNSEIVTIDLTGTVVDGIFRNGFE
jgi:hypothetical protein